MNDKKQWIPRLICLGLILGLLGLYQNHAQVWADSRSANQAEVEAANAHNQAVLAEKAARAAEAASPPKKRWDPIRTAAIPPRLRALGAILPSP